ncbi:MAG: hypothetical protein QM831_36300 [Kofleriaceae bacterium]
MRWHLFLAVVACCQTANGADPEPEPPRSPHHDAATQLHMRAKYGELHTIEHALVRGDFMTAKVAARAIAEAPDDAGLAEWKHRVSYVRELANEVAAAPTIDAALHALPTVAVACAECHVATGRWPKLAQIPAVPPDKSDTVARMARHQWAVDRMWDGLIAGDDHLWRQGLEVLAATPPPQPSVTRVAAGAALQQTAVTALQHQYIDTLDDRAAEYGTMLATCATCHTAAAAR